MNILDSDYNDSIWLAHNTNNNIPYFLELTSVLQTNSNECVSVFWTALHNLNYENQMAVRKKTSLQTILTINNSVEKLDKSIRESLDEGDWKKIIRLFDERRFLTNRLKSEYATLKRYARSLGSRE